MPTAESLPPHKARKLTVSFNAASKVRVEQLLAQYPVKSAALIPLLHIAQEQFGYLHEAVIDLVATTLEVTPAHVFGTAKFYDMFRFSPPAEHEIIVCRNLSCFLCGCDRLTSTIARELGVTVGEQSDKFSLREFECLAACDQAPVMMLDGKLYTKLDPNVLPDPLKKIVEEQA